jgi:DNA-binding PadR family transcriptional regulator
MDVGTLCLGVLSFGDTSGYGIRKAVEDWFRHFGQASLGAIYPALAKLTAKGAIEVIGAPVGANSPRRRPPATAARPCGRRSWPGCSSRTC